MKLLLTAPLLLLIASCSAPRASSTGATAKDEVRADHDRWFDGILNEDVAALETVLSDDMTFHAPHGATGTKAGFLSVLRPGQLEYDSVSVAEPLIRVYGNAAVVTGEVDILYRWENEPCLEWLTYTAVYGRADRGWRMLAWQSTYRPDSPCKG